MPVIAHVMILLVYLTAVVVGGAAAYVYGGVEPVTAGLMAALAALGFSQIHIALSRISEAQHGRKIREIGNDLRKFVHRVAEVERRAQIIEDRIDRELVLRGEALQSEMRGLEELIARQGRSLEARIEAVRVAASDTREGSEELEVLESVREAIRENRVDLHLQPIVNLPQRRVCFYEGFTRLRRGNGQFIAPAEFMGAAERSGLIGVIDNLLLFRCVQIVRKLSEKDRRIGVFCNVALSSFEDEHTFPAFLEFMRDNRDLAGSMVFEIGSRAFRERSEAAARNMGRLRDLGFRFSLDKCDSLVLDLPELQSMGVRYVKVSGELLLSQLVPGGGRPITAITRELAPEDVPAVFARYGVDLIAEKVEAEKSVIEILEFDIPFGQGHVFGSPRPIKGSLLEETAPPAEFVARLTSGAA